jgi:hypothetical protein
MRAQTDPGKPEKNYGGQLAAWRADWHRSRAGVLPICSNRFVFALLSVPAPPTVAPPETLNFTASDSGGGFPPA